MKIVSTVALSVVFFSAVVCLAIDEIHTRLPIGYAMAALWFVVAAFTFVATVLFLRKSVAVRRDKTYPEARRAAAREGDLERTGSP